MGPKSITPSGFSKPAAANPVMDVVTPPPAVQETPKEDKQIDPLDQLAAEDKASQASEATAKKTEKKPATKARKPARPGNASGVGLAISATVIIVIGLATLATYAYLQTAK